MIDSIAPKAVTKNEAKIALTITFVFLACAERRERAIKRVIKKTTINQCNMEK
jgi:hypothetical protein